MGPFPCAHFLDKNENSFYSKISEYVVIDVFSLCMWYAVWLCVTPQIELKKVSIFF